MSELFLPGARHSGVSHDHAHATAGYAPVRLLRLRTIHVRMDVVRANVLAEYRAGSGRDEQLIELAINEAEALAWQTGYPELVFPELAAEKARKAAASLAMRGKVLLQSRLDSQPPIESYASGATY
jgi:hypothetical protein